MKAGLALIVVVVLVVWGVIANTDSSAPARPQPSPHAATSHPQRATVDYTATDRLLIDSVDIAAGKAMRASTSPDGLFEGRTSEGWCGLAMDSESALVRHHSLSWASKVDHADDAESQKFQDAARACG